MNQPFTFFLQATYEVVGASTRGVTTPRLFTPLLLRRNPDDSTRRRGMMEACTERVFCRKAWRSERGMFEYKSMLGLVRGLSLLAAVAVDVAVESCAGRV